MHSPNYIHQTHSSKIVQRERGDLRWGGSRQGPGVKAHAREGHWLVACGVVRGQGHRGVIVGSSHCVVKRSSAGCLDGAWLDRRGGLGWGGAAVVRSRGCHLFCCKSEGRSGQPGRCVRPGLTTDGSAAAAGWWCCHCLGWCGCALPQSKGSGSDKAKEGGHGVCRWHNRGH